jgi:hypothetical protein
MAKHSKDRNVVGEHMRDLAAAVAARKINLAKAYARQTAEMQVMMLFGPGDSD